MSLSVILKFDSPLQFLYFCYVEALHDGLDSEQNVGTSITPKMTVFKNRFEFQEVSNFKTLFLAIRHTGCPATWKIWKC